MWMSCQCPFLWDIIILQTRPTFLIYADKFAPLLTSSRYPVSQIITKYQCSPWTAISSITLCMFNLNFIFSSIIFHFFAAFSSLQSNSLSVTCFYKMSCGFTTGRQGDHTTTCIAICVWIEQHMHGNQSNAFQKWYDWSLIPTHICYIHSGLSTKELATKFVLHAVTHR